MLSVFLKMSSMVSIFIFNFNHVSTCTPHKGTRLVIIRLHNDIRAQGDRKAHVCQEQRRNN